MVIGINSSFVAGILRMYFKLFIRQELRSYSIEGYRDFVVQNCYQTVPEYLALSAGI